MVLATITGLALTFVLLMLVFAGIVASAVSSGKKKTEIGEQTVLEFRPGLSIPDRSIDNPLAAYVEESDFAGTLGLYDILKTIDRAKSDSRIKGIVLRPEFSGSGFATIAELRSKIAEFRKSGKFVYCYADIMTEQAFYLASACDSIFIHPSCEWMFDGLSANIVMYKGLLDKAGIEMEVFRAGKYKSAVEPFIQKQISAENREQTKLLVETVFGQYIRDIAQSRKIDSATLAGYAHSLAITDAAAACSLRLADRRMQYDQFLAMAGKKAGLKEPGSLKPVKLADYAASPVKEEKEYSRDKIAIVYASGEISYGKSEEPDRITNENMAAALRKVREDKNVKAVVLRVNSPGGGSLASDIIAREIDLTRKVKPVIASFGNVAASGGYYIACLADTIVCLPQTITGSIGVFGLFPNTAKLFREHMGLTYESVGTGPNSDFGRPDGPMNDAQRQYIQAMVNRIYGDFVSIVARGRNLDTARVNALGQGRVWPGTEALRNGLADVNGGFEKAVQLAADRAKLKNYRVVEYPEVKFSLSAFFGSMTNAEAQMKSMLGSDYNFIMEMRKMTQRSGYQSVMPFEFEWR